MSFIIKPYVNQPCKENTKMIIRKMIAAISKTNHPLLPRGFLASN